MTNNKCLLHSVCEVRRGQRKQSPKVGSDGQAGELADLWGRKSYSLI